MSSLQEFSTWEPLLRIQSPGPGLSWRCSGQVGDSSGPFVSFEVASPTVTGGSAHRTATPPRDDDEARRAHWDALEDAVEPVQDALEAAGLSLAEWTVEVTAAGHARITVVTPESPEQNDEMVLVPGALPEPYRRRAAPPASGHPTGSTDLAELERFLQELWPDAEGMTDAEIDAAGDRLGVPVPDEARALYRVVRHVTHDPDDDREWDEVPVPFDVWALDSADRDRSRLDGNSWWFVSQTAGRTGPASKVQAVSQPPEWFVLGSQDLYTVALDMAPGPAGKVGQVIAWSDEDRWSHPFGAEVLADSLLDFVRGVRYGPGEGTWSSEDLPVFGKVYETNENTVESVASADLEVLQIYRSKRPVSVAPAVGLPRLRTLIASAGAITDPLEIGRMAGLEYLETGLADWLALLDADAVPRGLLACKVEGGSLRESAAVKDRIRDLWGLSRDPAPFTVEGVLA